MRIDITPVRSFEALGADWQALEAVAEGASFFQGWAWVGCLAEERFPDPVLLRATAPGGRLLGLALFNRRGRRLCLTESGEAALDAPFVEHNAPLVAEGADAAAVRRALLQTAWNVTGVRRLVLGGVPPALSAAAGGTAWRTQERQAPFIDLDAVRAAAPGGDWLGTLSANARYQIRRSDRRYAARGGAAPALAVAATEAEALAWLEALARLHASTWQARGQPGAFADRFAWRFHRALVQRALAAGQLQLLRVAAGSVEVGYLYNFRARGRVYAYQSGLALEAAGAHEKPGLTCHALAVQRALAAGDSVYDFLAGAQRYKRSLANAEAFLLWAELVPRWSVEGVVARAARTLYQ